MPFTSPVIVQASGEADAEQSDFVTAVPVEGVATTSYAEMAAPPVSEGPAKPTVTSVLPAATDVMTGTPGATAVIAMVLDTWVAAAYRLSPDWIAVTPQVPTASTVTSPVLDTEHAEFVVVR